MVYCGKPSKGCGQCRSRKVRCDQARPACSQCVRAKRECPGYRDPLSLMFRDESKSVERKAGNTSRTSTTAATSSQSSSSRSNSRSNQLQLSRTASPEGNSVRPEPASENPHFDFNSDPQHQHLMRQLWKRPLEMQPPTDLEAHKHEALCYFLNSNGSPGTFWLTSLVSDFLHQTGGPASARAMRASVTATAVAMLSRVKDMAPLKAMARKEYGSALRLINEALSDVKEAKTNQVLGSVVLMAIYEHIRGATALLDLRGPEQLETEAGLRLFLHLRHQTVSSGQKFAPYIQVHANFSQIIACIQGATRLPDSLLECSKVPMFLEPRAAYGNRLIITIGKLANLRADIRYRVFKNNPEILSAASAIEAELIAWMTALTPEFNYTVRTRSPFDFAFQHQCRGMSPYDDQYSVYPDLFVCNTWNQYRSARIIVSDIILSHSPQFSDNSSTSVLSDELSLHRESLRSTIRRLAVDICRSVPFHLDAHQEDVPTYHPKPQSYLGGLMLLWPLFLAGVAEGPNHYLRRWVMQCLHMIGHTMGIDQALALVEVVDANPGMLKDTIDESAVVDVSNSPEEEFDPYSMLPGNTPTPMSPSPGV
ncbi:hypothetical protein NUU61_006129 [Penicillium alfredii]|uniref:Zn(2)-C6 fungal-type domain-containing protein n=1 Tax=Penicillium alfredii TaxID=1506179 RepID=A0A9W9K310_9EURO|nr:uncharacterized protein NUU61_006129 [Penicillium alfredii]KAJ5091259.1 hypothetical protein NUU61_006129 [Penicillium alfredii]